MQCAYYTRIIKNIKTGRRPYDGGREPLSDLCATTGIVSQRIIALEFKCQRALCVCIRVRVRACSYAYARVFILTCVRVHDDAGVPDRGFFNS